MQHVVVGIGEALWDILPEGKKIGGAPANFAYHISQFGLSSCVVSAVGNDALGKELVGELRNKQLNMLIPTVNYPTGTVMVQLDSNGIPSYDITEDVAWDNIPFTPELETLAKSTCAMTFGSLAQRNEISRRTIHRFIDSMPEGDNVLKVFDINMRQNYCTTEIAAESLQKCNILKINDEELIVLSRMFAIPGINMDDMCMQILNEYQLKMVVLTCGVNGSYVFTDSGTSFMPTPVVDVADTVGAGDSFSASFIAAILKGKSVSEAHRLAADVSAFVCTNHGAMPTLSEELLSRLR
ncbi:MAG: carbohydrate kinase [Muribaculaceae bacterium]|nr:carbohydrate kinase [Muribaculaceae bacterium]